MTEKLSMEELMDLAEVELDTILAGERFADTTMWTAVYGFVQRVQALDKEAPARQADTAPEAKA